MHMRALAVVSAMVAAQPASAIVVTAIDAPGTPIFTGVRNHWGGTGAESGITSNTGQFLIGGTLNPAGAPVWTVGQPHKVRIFWSAATGAISLNVDFDRGGSFGTGEIISSTLTGMTLRSFRSINLSLTRTVSGANSNDISFNNLVINGNALGDYSASMAGTNGISRWFGAVTPGPVLKAIEITGDLVFRNTGGTGNFTNTRPTISVQFSSPIEVPEPSAWAMLLAGFGGIGLVLRRRRISLQTP